MAEQGRMPNPEMITYTAVRFCLARFFTQGKSDSMSGIIAGLIIDAIGLIVLGILQIKETKTFLDMKPKTQTIIGILLLILALVFLIIAGSLSISIL